MYFKNPSCDILSPFSNLCSSRWRPRWPSECKKQQFSYKSYMFSFSIVHFAAVNCENSFSMASFKLIFFDLFFFFLFHLLQINYNILNQSRKWKFVFSQPFRSVVAQIPGS